jgi:addiction module HigA family antidote
MAKLKPISPGEILKEDYLVPMNISAYKLSKGTGIPQMTLSNIIKGGTISPINCLILSKFFGLSEMYWMNLQADYDRRVCKSKSKARLTKVKDYHEYLSS